MAEAKTIYCPRCGRAACHYDGRQTINPVGKCKKCKKLIVYNVDTGETRVEKIPARTQSSGKRFY